MPLLRMTIAVSITNAMIDFLSTALLLLIPFLYGCSDSHTVSEENRAGAALSVNGYQLEQSRQYDILREYAGLVQSDQRANLGAEIAGKVAQVHVDVGVRVAEGQRLLTLDTQILEVNENQLNAQKAKVESQLELARRNLSRLEAIRDKGFGVQADIDDVQSQQSAHRADLKRLAAEIEANRIRMDKSVIRAPYSGEVAERFVSIGDVVNQGTPTFSLLSNSSKEAHVGVPVRQLDGLLKGNVKGKRWQIRVGDQVLPAVLINSGGRVESGAQTVNLRFSLMEDARLLSGQLAYLQHQERQDQEGFWIPVSALTDGVRGSWNVFSLVPDEHQLTVKSPKRIESPQRIESLQRVERRTVQVLFTGKDQAYVTGSLMSGESIVRDGLHRITPGQPVRLAIDVQTNSSDSGR